MRPTGRRGWLTPVLVAAAFFLAIAPTLPWLEFSGGSENLVAETVLEMRRGGPWFIPTLQGIPRLTKPPWTAWLAAAAARPETVSQLSTPDPSARESAFRQFAWQVRWPTLLSACAMLAATYALGELLLGRPAGLVAACACGSSLLFLRFCRSATTDVQLALWVTAANAFLAAAVFRRRYWLGFVGAGAALGMSVMSKGPVGLAQSVLPFGVFLLWRWIARTRDAMPAPAPAPAPRDTRGRGPALPALVGLVVMLAVALPWFLVVASKHPTIWGHWYQEVTRKGATQLGPDPWYTYFVFPVWLVPWLSFLVAGFWLGGLSLVRQTEESPDAGRRRDGFVLALLLVVVPLLVMSLAKDKNERYAFPMVAPAAVLAAGAAVGWWKSDRRDVGGRIVEAAHWATLLVLAVGLSVFGPLAPRLGMGEPWFSPAVGAATAVVVLAVVAGGFAMSRWAPVAGGRAVTVVAVTTALAMLLLQYPFMHGYARRFAPARSELKPLADVVWAQHPDALLYQYEGGARTRVYHDLSIYTGRPTTLTRDPAALPQTDRPRVVFYLDRRGDVQPPGGAWKQLASGGEGKNRWQAFVLPAAR